MNLWPDDRPEEWTMWLSVLIISTAGAFAIGMLLF